MLMKERVVAIGIVVALSVACNRQTGKSESSSASDVRPAVDPVFPQFVPEVGLRWDVGNRVMFFPVRSKSVRGEWRGRYPRFDAPVDEMAGRVAKVISCEKDSGGHRTVGVQVEDSGKVFQGRDGRDFSLDDWAILAENYERARTMVGKTLWTGRCFPEPFDERANVRKADRSLPFPGRLQPVQVVDVMLTDESRTPLRLILTWHGAKFFTDVHYGDPGVGRQLRYFYRLQDQFLDVDPSLRWSEETIRAVRESRITIGMTSEQVLLIWGEPTEKNNTVTASGASEQWIYPGDNYLYFDNGIMTSYQSPNR